MSFQNDLNNLTKVKGVTHKNVGTPPPTDQLSDYDVWWDAVNKEFRVRKDSKWVSDYGYGYGVGGLNTVSISYIDRITFPFDSGTASVVGNVSGTRTYGSSSNSSVHGFCMGGYETSYLTTIDRIIFPFNSGTSTKIGNLFASRYAASGCNSSK